LFFTSPCAPTHGNQKDKQIELNPHNSKTQAAAPSLRPPVRVPSPPQIVFAVHCRGLARRTHRGRAMSGRFSRSKGLRAERGVVALLQDAGFAAERVPLSGAARGRFGGDISVPILGTDRRIEVKCRATGFSRLYTWLADTDFLVLKADRREPLVVLRLSEAISLITQIENRVAE
jgi:Holliday junction resolvase